jgi:ATP-binding cassette subfamily F protein 3
VLISHDRYFLDVTVDRIIEIWNKGVHFYSGNYETYLAQKQERRDSLVSAYKNQRERIEQLEAFINRFRYQATKAKQVQSRVKELEKIERIEIPPEEKTIHFTFPQPNPSGRTVVECAGVAKCYGRKEVFRNVDFTIQRGDRVALVGVNGAGKSTLIKLLAGTEPLTEGTMKLGHNVDPDYFAQDQYKELDRSRRMLDDLSDVAPQKATSELRGLLGCFLFSEDDVFKPIGVLSGGERNRYALARMLLHPSNFLLLDEPTNHLDMRAKDVLLESLEKYNGTVVFVSHDRYFIDKLATRVFEIGDGCVEVFPGNYEDYLWRKQRLAEGVDSQIEKAASAPTLSDVPGYEPPKPDTRKRMNPIKLKQMQDRRQQLESEIADLEQGIADCERELQAFVSAEETQRQTDLLARQRSNLATRMAEWEELSQTLETSG